MIKICLYLVKCMGVLTQTGGNTLPLEPKRTQRALPRNSFGGQIVGLGNHLGVPPVDVLVLVEVLFILKDGGLPAALPLSLLRRIVTITTLFSFCCGVRARHCVMARLFRPRSLITRFPMVLRVTL